MSRIGDLLRQGMADQPESEPRGDMPQERTPFDGKVLMHPSNMALLAYWRLTRGVQTLPAWAQIDLLEISEHLKNLLMIEWRAGTDPVVRFAGPDIVSWIGMEPTSHGLFELLGRDLCAALPQETEQVRKAERLLLLQTKYQTRADRAVLLENLCLPLCDDKGNLRYLLIGCQWLGGSFAHGDDPDTIDLNSMIVAQKTLLPLDADSCPAEAAPPVRRHPWVARTTSAA